MGVADNQNRRQQHPLPLQDGAFMNSQPGRMLFLLSAWGGDRFLWFMKESLAKDHGPWVCAFTVLAVRPTCDPSVVGLLDAWRLVNRPGMCPHTF